MSQGTSPDRASIARAYTRNHILGQRIGATILDMGVFIVAFVVVVRSFPTDDNFIWWLSPIPLHFPARR